MRSSRARGPLVVLVAVGLAASGPALAPAVAEGARPVDPPALRPGPSPLVAPEDPGPVPIPLVAPEEPGPVPIPHVGPETSRPVLLPPVTEPGPAGEVQVPRRR